MTKFINQPEVQGLLRFDGIIKGYKSIRSSASFVFTETDKNHMGVVAIAAALAGLGGQAIAVASNATSLEEEADFLEFKLGDKTLKGWVWRSPFEDGDEVRVAAEWNGEYFEIFGIARPRDRMIALYPHCSRAKTRHILNAVKWWLIVSIGIQLFVTIFTYFISDLQETLELWGELMSMTAGRWLIGGLTVVLGIATFSMTRQWMPFVRVAEKVFRTLELPNARNLDLVKSSKSQRTDKDAAEFGSFYFRY
jgi:hypothetical protein